MKNLYSFDIKYLFLFIFSFFIINIQAQENSEILEVYEDYTVAPREVVYVHLNKSTFISEENIGFTAYVFDKQTKKPSLLTSNLYVSIEDANNNTIKKALLKVENGVTSNVFVIDSTFSSGNYTFKAYTNWMLNFKESNCFRGSFEVIDKEKEYIETNVVKNDIDAQFLPEGGHLLHNVVNKIGVVIKDYKGYGITNVNGKVFDKNNTLITEFKTNHLGIGKFLLLADFKNNYKIEIDHFNRTYNFNLNHKIEPIGINISVTSHRDKTLVALTTNKESLKLIKNKPYFLALHNGKQIDIIDITFNNENSIVKVFDKNTLTSGINILTLFNENNQPIVERLVFNYNGIDILNSNTLVKKEIGDSIQLKLNYKTIDPSVFNNLSVSILPKETISYNHHQNILSSILLKPYIKGSIEEAKYYFTNITETKKRELDNLLITQGWSSYDWNNIFKGKPNLDHNFEQGISLKANINNSDASETTYAMQTHNSEETQYFSINDLDTKHFFVDSLFPYESEKIYFSKFHKDEFVPTKFYIHTTPQKIPVFSDYNNPLLSPKKNYKIAENLRENLINLKKLNKVHKLNEVTVVADKNAKRFKIERLSKHKVDRALVVDTKMSNSHLYLSDLIARGAFKVFVDHRRSSVFVYNRGKKASRPAIYINDVRILSAKDLYMYSSKLIDYITFSTSNYSMVSETISKRHITSGSVRIYTKEYSEYMPKGYKKQEYLFPLTFRSKKRFYIPKYKSYNDDFFRNYGVIDWIPNLKINKNGTATITIAKPEIPITLFIEGIANDGSFIFEEKSIFVN